MAADALVILQQALTKEEDRRSYYEDAAQRAANPLAQQTFTFLAQEEDKHAEYIQQFYEQMKAGQGWPDASECSEECKLEAAQVKEIFTNAREAIDGEVTSDTDLTDAYDLAMQGERDSIEFYKDDDRFLELGEPVPTYRPPFDDTVHDPASYPLALLSPHSKWRIHSTYANNAWLTEIHGGRPEVFLSAPDADARGVATGDLGEVVNPRGAVRAWASTLHVPSSAV